ncbi:MAG: IS6 family transposase [Mariprofundus sp.]|nr:IS6 family transposase [Mariprofundus sp.]
MLAVLWRTRYKLGFRDIEQLVIQLGLKVDRETIRAWVTRFTLIVSENLELLEKKKESRQAIMENGAQLDGPYFTSDLEAGEDLDFHYIVTNTNLGHNMPSGSLGAQPQLWVNVALINPNGKNVWESGYVDSQGDIADIHSTDVQAGKIEFDDQLVNFQTKFLTTNVKGTDREMFLPINFDIDQRPLIRPANAPNSVLNHPAFVRMESHSLPPLGTRKAKYSVPGDKITMPGIYKLAIRMRSRAEPIAFMSFIGATTDMKRAMNEGMLDAHAYTVEFEVLE